MALSDQQRAQLDGIVKQMDGQGASSDDIKAVVQDFTSKHSGSGVAQSTPTQFGLDKATGIGPTPWYQSHRIPGTSIDLPFSAEDAAEALPAAVAGGAALVATDNPGAAGIAGGVAGEAGRQMFRRAVGVPAATGVVQRRLGLDPDSTEAAAAGLGGEAAAGIVGAGAGKAMGALGRGAEHSAERSIVRDVLGGARTEREIAEAPALAKRAQAAGIVNGMTKRSRLAKAQAALGAATTDATNKTATASAAGATVEAQPVLDAIQAEVPSSIPGGGSRTAAAPERRAANRVLNDELSAVANMGGGATGTEIPLHVALGEIDALDSQLEAMYRRGALDPALGKSAAQAGATGFRKQLRAALPEVADARLKQHELITITNMLKRGLAQEFTGGGGGNGVAGAVGSAAVGRLAPASSGIFSSLAGAAAPLSIPARQVLSRVLAGGSKTAQLWVRAADANGLNTDDQMTERELNRKAALALKTQATGVVAP